jgi:hypothetical protein
MRPPRRQGMPIELTMRYPAPATIKVMMALKINLF